MSDPALHAQALREVAAVRRSAIGYAVRGGLRLPR